MAKMAASRLFFSSLVFTAEHVMISLLSHMKQNPLELLITFLFLENLDAYFPSQFLWKKMIIQEFKLNFIDIHTKQL